VLKAPRTDACNFFQCMANSSMLEGRAETRQAKGGQSCFVHNEQNVNISVQMQCSLGGVEGMT
jgi:hypothetical protein